ncbi:uncharacterized protein I206_103871 [Kwoniella pini CBS 10737]|uniref:Uncharacterized protein n=1 Tax=Kwoniella pini CBS 10737 TaxID=1296096 RepID=A0A1B9I3B6_9TREE|nr:uncharacterized protein I206_04557 [Kwoniella pini CBS 10737]OCF50026.1 hypothetical protein I206_04557 [Kwoniella pini CBS 10737]
MSQIHRQTSLNAEGSGLQQTRATEIRSQLDKLGLQLTRFGLAHDEAQPRYALDSIRDDDRARFTDFHRDQVVNTLINKPVIKLCGDSVSLELTQQDADWIPTIHVDLSNLGPMINKYTSSDNATAEEQFCLNTASTFRRSLPSHLLQCMRQKDFLSLNEASVRLCLGHTLADIVRDDDDYHKKEGEIRSKLEVMWSEGSQSQINLEKAYLLAHGEKHAGYIRSEGKGFNPDAGMYELRQSNALLPTFSPAELNDHLTTVTKRGDEAEAARDARKEQGLTRSWDEWGRSRVSNLTEDRKREIEEQMALREKQFEGSLDSAITSCVSQQGYLKDNEWQSKGNLFSIFYTPGLGYSSIDKTGLGGRIVKFDPNVDVKVKYWKRRDGPNDNESWRQVTYVPSMDYYQSQIEKAKDFSVQDLLKQV